MSGWLDLLDDGVEPAAPPSGLRRFFALNGLPKLKSSTGTLVDFTGPQGPPGAGTTLEEVQDFIGQTLVDSPNIDVTYNDAGNIESFVWRNPYLGTVVGASKTYAALDIGGWYERSNAGAAMTDTLPTLTAADNGYIVGVHNTDPTAAITFTAGGGVVIGTSATSYALQPLCRQTFIWTGTKWLFGAGNANLTKSPTAGTVQRGDLLAVTDTTGRQLTRSGRSVTYVSILDFGADRTGATSITAALDAAIAALGGGGGVVEFPAGVYLENTAPYIVSANNVTLWAPAGPNATILKTTNTTGDQLRLTGYGCRIEGFSVQGPGTGTTSNKTAGIGLDIQSQEGAAWNCSFAYQFDACRIGGGLVDVYDLWVRFFKRHGIVVDQESDHRITRVSMVNNAATLPTGAGIYVTRTASLVLDQLNIIASNFALDIAPAAGVTIPSVKGLNCFFDTSAVGLNMTAAGAFLRSEFTNCWFSSMSVAGVRLQPAVGGQADGITFVNCDIYNNVGGTTTGIDTNALTGRWKLVACNIAGWTVGINLVAGATHYPTILSNTIGAISAFVANGTGLVIGAGTFQGFLIQGNDVIGNTVAATIGAFVVAAGLGARFRIVDNPGINPRGAVTTPAFPASTTDAQNLTGFRVLAMVKYGATAPTAVRVNGVTTNLPVINQQVGIVLEPGGSFGVTGTLGTWVWVGL